MTEVIQGKNDSNEKMPCLYMKITEFQSSTILGSPFNCKFTLPGVSSSIHNIFPFYFPSLCCSGVPKDMRIELGFTVPLKYL